MRKIILLYCRATFVLLLLLAVSTASTQANDQDEDRCYYFQGKLAVDACSRLIDSRKYKGEVLGNWYRFRGLMREFSGQLDLAIADYKEAIIAHPRDALSYMTLGRVYLAQGDQRRAMEYIEQALRTDPSLLYPRVLRANVYKLAGDDQRALAEYDQVFKIKTLFDGLFQARGDFHRDTGNFDQALADYNSLIISDDNNQLEPGLTGRADLMRLQGKIDEALILYEEVLRRRPLLKGAIRGREIILARQKDPNALVFHSVKEGLDRLRDLNRAGDSAKALEAANALLALPEINDVQKCEVLQTRSVLLANFGKISDGVEDRLQCVKIRIDTVHSNARNLQWAAWRDTANLLRDAGHFENAFKAIDSAEKIAGPDTFSAYRASLFEAKEDYAAAAAIYEKYLANPPNVTSLHALTRPSALRSLAWIKFRQGDEKQALSLMEQSFKLQSEDPGAQVAMAHLLAAIGRGEDAIKLLAASEAKAKEPRIRNILMMTRGLMEVATGKDAEAVKTMSEGVKAFGNDLMPNWFLLLAQFRASDPGDSNFAKVAAGLNPASWNGKLAQFMLGKITRQEIEAAAKHPLPANERSQRCTMHFVAGQLALRAKDIDTARRDLTATLELCHPGGQNYPIAKYDLERLKK